MVEALLWESTLGRINRDILFAQGSKDSMPRYNILSIQEALCARGEYMTIAVERLDFAKLKYHNRDTEAN